MLGNTLKVQNIIENFPLDIIFYHSTDLGPTWNMVIVSQWPQHDFFTSINYQSQKHDQNSGLKGWTVVQNNENQLIIKSQEKLTRQN